MLKVAMITRDFPPKIGGISTYTSELVKRLPEHGVDISVFAGYNDFKTSLLPLCVNLRSYDLIHCQGTPFGAFLPGNKPILLTAHSTIQVDKLYHRGFKRVYYELGCFMERRTLKNSSHIIAVSKVMKEQLMSIYGMEESLITVLPHGVDIDSFHPYTDAPKKDICTILTVGRLDPIKRTDIVIESLKGIPHQKYILQIVGDGSDMQRLRQKASESGVNANFMGWVMHERIAEIFREADIFISCSGSETFNLSLFEALASGCAVIVSNISEHRKIIKEGINGILFNSYHELSEKIRMLIENDKLRSRIRTNARNSVLEYSWDKTVKKIVEIYRQLVK
jgi:glycosyltransferase involved in cell wall biosynthesis